MIPRENIGLDLAVAGFLITLVGVIYNNLLLDHWMAMFVWQFSNVIFAWYFFGRSYGWWNGHIGDEIMVVNYLFMAISGVYGLWFA